MRKSQNKSGRNRIEKERRKNMGEKGKKKAKEGKGSEKLYFISKIYGDRAVGFRMSTRQS